MVGHSENKITSSRECFSLLKRMIMCNRFDLSINKPKLKKVIWLNSDPDVLLRGITVKRSCRLISNMILHEKTKTLIAKLIN